MSLPVWRDSGCCWPPLGSVSGWRCSKNSENVGAVESLSQEAPLENGTSSQSHFRVSCLLAWLSACEPILAEHRWLPGLVPDEKAARLSGPIPGLGLERPCWNLSSTLPGCVNLLLQVSVSSPIQGGGGRGLPVPSQFPDSATQSFSPELGPTLLL